MAQDLLVQLVCLVQLVLTEELALPECEVGLVLLDAVVHLVRMV